MELSQDKVDLQLRTLKVINGNIKFMKIFLLVNCPHLNLSCKFIKQTMSLHKYGIKCIILHRLMNKVIVLNALMIKNKS